MPKKDTPHPDRKPFTEVDWPLPRHYMLMMHQPERADTEQEVLQLISNAEVIGHRIELDEGKSLTITLKLPGYVEPDVGDST